MLRSGAGVGDCGHIAAVEELRKQGATVDVVDFSFGTTPDEMAAEFYKLALAGSMGGLFAGYADTDRQLKLGIPLFFP